MTGFPSVRSLFPPLEVEFAPFLDRLEGEVLNAGSGDRNLRGLVPGRVHNQDIVGGLHNRDVDIVSPLHRIPVEDDFFDAIVCNAVLEHVDNPHEVITEFARVTKPGGVLYLCVPFLQPEHLDPTDFQRFTMDGLALLVERKGFDVEEKTNVHNVYVTLGWILSEWLGSVDDRKHRALARVLLPWIWRQARTSQHRVHSIGSAYRIVARRSERPPSAVA